MKIIPCIKFIVKWLIRLLTALFFVLMAGIFVIVVIAMVETIPLKTFAGCIGIVVGGYALIFILYSAYGWSKR